MQGRKAWLIVPENTSTLLKSSVALCFKTLHLKLCFKLDDVRLWCHQKPIPVSCYYSVLELKATWALEDCCDSAESWQIRWPQSFTLCRSMSFPIVILPIIVGYWIFIRQEIKSSLHECTCRHAGNWSTRIQWFGDVTQYIWQWIFAGFFYVISYKWLRYCYPFFIYIKVFWKSQ